MSGYRTSLERDLTEFPQPLIIILLRFDGYSQGVGRALCSAIVTERSRDMKVNIYKEPGGTFAIMVQASPGKGKPPVVVLGLAVRDVAGAVRPIVDEMRRPKESRPSDF